MSRTQQESPPGSLANDIEEEKKPAAKSRRPPNNAFRQQRLKAWQPILTPKTVLPLFFAVGIIFAPLGGVMLWASNQVQEISIDYTNCGTIPPLSQSQDQLTFVDMPSDRVHSSFKATNSSCVADGPARWARYPTQVPIGISRQQSYNSSGCRLQFNIPNDMGPPVFLYYRLTKFYQNHRRYVKSLWQDQLSGKAVSAHDIDNSDCDPLKLDKDGRPYYPCGLIANSQFNDTIAEPFLTNVPGSNEASRTYPMTDKGIAWASDQKLYGVSQYNTSQVVPPLNWRKRYPDGYNEDFPLPPIHTDEAFQVWMRTAGLPTFSKLSRRNDDTSMTCGQYELDIVDEFPVQLYGGTKEILISTRTVLGGKNPFLGIAYLVVGGLCIILGAVFTGTHLIRPRKLGDHTYLSWNNDQPSTATTTGRSLRPQDNA